jgi:hypothetical protein
MIIGLSLVATFMAVSRAPAARADASGRGGDYVPLSPTTHLLDTRNGTGGISGLRTGGSTTAITVLGKAGVPASGVSAVLLDVSPVRPTAQTFLTLWPHGTPRPGVSMVNAGTNEIISNSAVVQVGSNGQIDLYNAAGSTHVSIDVQGYFTQTSSGGTGAGGFMPITSTRLVDTRAGLGAPRAAIPSGGSLTVTLATGPVPTTANAVFLNIIVPSAAASGWLAAYPVGGTAATSIFDFMTGTTDTGAAVKIGTGGKVTFVNHSASAAHLVLDAHGYFSPSTTEGAGLRTAGVRLFDSRSTAALASNATVDVSVGGTNGLPTRGIAGAALNLSVISPTAGGFLRAWPLGDPEPTISHTNFGSGPGRDALAVVRPGIEGKVRIRNLSSAAVHFVVDLEGWFADPLPSIPIEQFSRTTVIQGTPPSGGSVSMLEFAYTNNIGQLVHGSTDPCCTDGVVYTVISGNEGFSGQPALSEQADGRLQVVAQNTSSDIWVKTQTTKSPPVWPVPFVNQGGSMASSPAIGRQGDGTLVVFAVDADGRLWSMAQNGPNGAYLSWRSHGQASLVGAPTVVPVSNGLRVFALDTSGALKTALYAGGTLSAWTNLGGSGMTGSPAVVVYPGWRLRVFMRGADGTIVTKLQDTSGAFPAAWDPVAGLTAAGSPSAVLSPSGRTEVVARGTDGAVYSTGETAQGSGIWRSWVDVTTQFGATAATDPTAFTYLNGGTQTWAFTFRDPDSRPWIFRTDTSSGALTLQAAETPDAPPTFHAVRLPMPPS